MPSLRARTSDPATHANAPAPGGKPRQASRTAAAAAAAAHDVSSSPQLPALVIDAGAHTTKIAVVGSSRSSSIATNKAAAHVRQGPSPPPQATTTTTTTTKVYTSPNVIARAKSSSLSSSSSREPFVGGQLLTRCRDFASLALRAPMQRGLVVDWPAQTLIWDQAISAALEDAERAAKDSPDGSPPARLQTQPKAKAAAARLLEGRTVIITEAYFNLPELEEAFDALMFERYGVAALWRASAAQLVPYAPIFSQGAHGSNDDEASHDVARVAEARREVKAGAQRRQRPEKVLVVDVGHSAVHVVPIDGHDAVWSATRRLDISGRLLTNLLKETVSFRQWDMMDEALIMEKVKETCCFVAAEAGVRARSAVGSAQRRRHHFLGGLGSPSAASFAQLMEVMRLCKRPSRNPLAQEYVLPDYSNASSDRQASRRFGYVRSGPGAPYSAGARAPSSRRDGQGRRGDLDEDDLAIADEAKWRALAGQGNHEGVPDEHEGEDEGDEDESEDDDADDDFLDEPGGEFRPRPKKKRKRRRRDEAADGGGRAGGEAEDEELQTLNLAPERFQVPEVYFAPSMIGLDQPPLPQVIQSAIEACPSSWRDMLWSSIVLVGGGARMRGLKRRLENELRPVAPCHVALRITQPEEPELAAVHGGAALAAHVDSPTSPLGRVLRRHLVTAKEWHAVPAAAQGAAARTRLGRARFGTWSQAALARSEASVGPRGLRI